MERWARAKYHPCLPLGVNGTRVTGCREHRELSYRAACDGTVLLKNKNALLPLSRKTRLAVFGCAQTDYVKGGGGSGDVTAEYVSNICGGLKELGFDLYDELTFFYEAYVDFCIKNGGKNGRLEEPDIPLELLCKAAEYTDTAVVTINRYSEEGSDRKHDGTDAYYNLSVNEQSMVDAVCKNFSHVIVMLNTGAMIDTSWFFDNDSIEAALMLWQGGMEGGRAAAAVLAGHVNPSGKLADTLALSFDDYPSSEGFSKSPDYVMYTEDIFVGYRYFETVPDMARRVVYPFGFGLSYTDFEISNIRVCDNGEIVFVSASVKNTGSYAGREVVQVYYAAPSGRITKPARSLCAFRKTRLLNPGESETVIMTFRIFNMASYDDTGVIEKSAYVMEKGVYRFFVGNSVRNTAEAEYTYVLDDDLIVKKRTSLCAPKRLGKRLMSDGTYDDVPDSAAEVKEFECDYTIADKPEVKIMFSDAASGKAGLDEFIAQLDTDEMMRLVTGIPNRGVANTCGMGGLEEYGVPTLMTADGPAGVRINPECGVNTTAFPVASMLACTWDPELIEEIGRAGALEMKENNLYIWLTPALNIHRSPLCGRNFEYFSEDPLIAGKMAAAMVRGIQSQDIIATPKHFACNNKETNRMESDSVVSERALREIYLKGFEICVKESSPRLIMTSYNRINGIHSSENAELITGILRGEWGYKGAVTTDWWNTADHAREIAAGNDIRMPSGDIKKLKKDFEAGIFSRQQLAACAKRILEMILHTY